MPGINHLNLAVGQVQPHRQGGDELLAAELLEQAHPRVTRTPTSPTRFAARMPAPAAATAPHGYTPSWCLVPGCESGASASPG